MQGDTGSTKNSFKFVVHGKHIVTSKYDSDSEAFVHTNVPLRNIVHGLSIKTILDIAQIHGIKISSHVPKAVMVTYRDFDTHYCATCNDAITIFSVVDKPVADRNRNQIPTDNTYVESGITEDTSNSVQWTNLPPFQTGKVNCTKEVKQNTDRGLYCERPVRVRSRHTRATGSTSTTPTFPPSPPDNKLLCDIARDFCFDSSPDKMEEAGCAVCGQLTPSSKLTKLTSVKHYLHVLQAEGITRIERKEPSEPIQEYKGPVIDHRCNRICDDCRKQLRKGQVPRNALAKGLWIHQQNVTLLASVLLSTYPTCHCPQAAASHLQVKFPQAR